jgi:hypothetical protein
VSNAETNARAALLESLDREIRASVRAQDYGKATELLSEYDRRLAEALPAMSGDKDASEGLQSRAEGLFRWARITVLAGQAHDQARLGQIDHARQYRRPDIPSGHCWCYEA